MTPRVQMACVDSTDPVSEVIELSGATGFSKFPVIKGSADNVVGSVHVKQAVAVPRSERHDTLVREVMVDATVVPESLRLDPLLSLLRGEGFQMAIVSDEYGGTAGVVTLEDVVEEIVGDIADEHDRYGSRLRQRPDGSWIVSGLLRPDEVADATGLELPEDEDYDTVAGLLVRELGRIPARGDRVVVPLPVVHPRGRRRGAGPGARADARRADGRPARRPDLAAQARARPPETGGRHEHPVRDLARRSCCCSATRSSSARSSRSSRPVVRRWSRRRPTGSRVARTTLRAMEQLSLMIAAAQFGITVCSLGLGAVAEPAVAHLIEPLAELVGLPDGVAAPGRVHGGDGVRGLPARRARRDGAEEPRARRPRARRDGARPADGGDGDGAQADRARPRRGGQRGGAVAADRAAHRDRLELHPRGGGGDGRRVAPRGDARRERVRAALRRPRVHLAHRRRGAAAPRPRSRRSSAAPAPPTSS